MYKKAQDGHLTLDTFALPIEGEICPGVFGEQEE